MPKRVLGIELGPQSVTLVQLTGTPRTYSMTAAVHQPLPQAADAAEQAAQQQAAVRDLLSRERLRGDTVVATLPAQHAVLRNLALPFKDPRRMHQVIKFALEDHMPFESDEVVADFQVLAAGHQEQTPLLVAAMPQEVVAAQLAMLQAVGLEPTVLDLDVFALANAALLGYHPLKPTTVLLDLQPARTLLTVLAEGVPVFARALSQGLPSADTPLDQYVSRLSTHLRHSLYACEHARQQACEPDLLLLSGEQRGRLEALATTLQGALGMPTEVWQLATGSYKSGSTPLAPEEQTRYAVAFGAAVRGLDRRAVGINLRRERFALHRDLEELRGRLVGVGIMLLAVVGLGLVSIYLDTQYKTQRYHQLQSEIARIFQTTLPQTRMVQPTFQLREKIREMEDRLRAFGGLTGAQLSGLQILHEISARVPASVILEVDNITITTDTTDLSGTTNSYDDVVKLKDALEGSPFFASVKINNTKTDVQDKVAFKLTVFTAKGLEQSL